VSGIDPPGCRLDFPRKKERDPQVRAEGDPRVSEETVSAGKRRKSATAGKMAQEERERQAKTTERLRGGGETFEGKRNISRRRKPPS